MEDLVVRNRAIEASRRAGDAFPLAELEKSLRRPRSLFSFLMNGIVTLLTLSALVPLFSVVYMLLAKGGHKLSLSLFTSLPPAAFEEGGGFGNAVAGTLVMVGIAALVSVPLGILAAVFLAEVGPQTRLAHVVRFGAKVLSGFPSILAGVFAYGAVVLATGGFSAYAGGVALALLMLPTVMLTAEDAICMVPARIREAAVGMGQDLEGLARERTEGVVAVVGRVQAVGRDADAGGRLVHRHSAGEAHVRVVRGVAGVVMRVDVRGRGLGRQRGVAADGRDGELGVVGEDAEGGAGVLPAD